MAAGAVGISRSRRKAWRRSRAWIVRGLLFSAPSERRKAARYTLNSRRCAWRLASCLGGHKLPGYCRGSERCSTMGFGRFPGSDGDSRFENRRRSALVAQRIEHLTSDQKVGSSSLSGGTKLHFCESGIDDNEPSSRGSRIDERPSDQDDDHLILRWPRGPRRFAGFPMQPRTTI